MTSGTHQGRFRVLVVDDEEAARVGLARIVRRPGIEVEVAESGEEARQRILERGEDYHLVLTDYRMPGMSGKQLLELLVKERPLTRVIMVTGQGTMAVAVECMKLGAHDFIEKPFEIEVIRHRVNQVLEMSQLSEDRVETQKSLALKGGGNPVLVWEDPVMQQTILLAQRVAMTDDPILIEGESGSGKELMARLIHQFSRVRDRKFVAINCGAFSEDLLVSELFGHEKGAFTGALETKPGIFEAVEGGSLFLDEIADLPMPMQARFLRAVEQKEIYRIGGRKAIPVDFRLIAASNRSLEKMTQTGEFRQDLFFRLRVHFVTVPPLRRRPADIQVLFDHFSRGLEQDGFPASTGLTPAAVAVLGRYRWPGNVRELGNLVRQMAVTCPGRLVDVADLPEAYRSPSSNPPSLDDGSETLEKVKLEHVRQALEKTEGNRTQAARLLGMSRVSLHRYLTRYPELSRVGKGEDL